MIQKSFHSHLIEYQVHRAQVPNSSYQHLEIVKSTMYESEGEFRMEGELWLVTEASREETKIELADFS